jgi:heme exporter protein A
MLNVHDLHCSRGRRQLVKGLSFTLGPGEWIQVRGDNGAGKTTLLRTVAGLCSADQGSIHWCGQPVAGNRHDFARDLIYLGHALGAKDDLNALENLRASLALDDVPVDEPALRAALARMGLRGRERLPARSLSAGQRRRLVQARLLLRPARLWVLDEPFTALDPAGVALMCELLGEHLARGGMALLTSHQPIPHGGGRELSL